MLQVHAPMIRHFTCTALAHVRSQFLPVWPPMFDQMLPLPLCLDAYRRSCHAFAARRICYPKSCSGFCKTLWIRFQQNNHSTPFSLTALRIVSSTALAKKNWQPRMHSYRRVYAREGTRLYPLSRGCVNFFFTRVVDVSIVTMIIY